MIILLFIWSAIGFSAYIWYVICSPFLIENSKTQDFLIGLSVGPFVWIFLIILNIIEFFAEL